MTEIAAKISKRQPQIFFRRFAQRISTTFSLHVSPNSLSNILKCFLRNSTKDSSKVLSKDSHKKSPRIHSRISLYILKRIHTEMSQQILLLIFLFRVISPASKLECGIIFFLEIFKTKSNLIFQLFLPGYFQVFSKRLTLIVLQIPSNIC